MDVNELQAMILDLQNTIANLEATISSLKSTVTLLQVVIGALVVLIIFLLIYVGSIKSKFNALRADNGEMIKRLKIISKSKIVD